MHKEPAYWNDDSDHAFSFQNEDSGNDFEYFKDDGITYHRYRESEIREQERVLAEAHLEIEAKEYLEWEALENNPPLANELSETSQKNYSKLDVLKKPRNAFGVQILPNISVFENDGRRQVGVNEAGEIYFNYRFINGYSIGMDRDSISGRVSLLHPLSPLSFGVEYNWNDRVLSLDLALGFEVLARKPYSRVGGELGGRAQLDINIGVVREEMENGYNNFINQLDRELKYRLEIPSVIRYF